MTETRAIVTRTKLVEFLTQLDGEFASEGRVFLIGETSQVLEGWRQWTTRVEVCSAVHKSERSRFNACLRAAAAHTGCAVTDECPGEVVPLPAGYDERSIPPSDGLGLRLDVRHYDPYSVAIRFIARGSEPDYHLALAYIDHGWIRLDKMEELLDGLLPEFSFSTIQQDPAEFRRRYGGLMQMVKTLQPGVTHRPTPV